MQHSDDGQYFEDGTPVGGPSGGQEVAQGGPGQSGSTPVGASAPQPVAQPQGHPGGVVIPTQTEHYQGQHYPGVTPAPLLPDQLEGKMVQAGQEWLKEQPISQRARNTMAVIPMGIIVLVWWVASTNIPWPEGLEAWLPYVGGALLFVAEVLTVNRTPNGFTERSVDDAVALVRRAQGRD